MVSTLPRKRVAGLLAFVVAVAAAPGLAAQSAPGGSGATDSVEADGIRCWWRTSSSAIRLGEPFSLILTCAAVDTPTAAVVVDQSRLEPSVMQFPPFEVISGVRGADLHSDTRRFFQYQYTVRLLNGDLFGKDAVIPGQQINYKIQTRVGRGEAVTGRDHIYLLPPTSIRVLSLVQEDAADIRDAPGWTFGDIDARRFRARVFVIVGSALFAIGGVVVLFALVRLLRRFRSPAVGGGRHASDQAILWGVGRELSDVRARVQRGGWTHDLVSRALAVFRVAGAIALGRRVSQTLAAAGKGGYEGQIVVRGGFLGRKKVLVSGSVTADAVARALAQARGDSWRQTLEDLRTALARLTAAEFGRESAFDAAALDESLTSGFAALRRLKFLHLWPVRKFRELTARVAAVGSRAWSR